jgi:hypothetical protein
MKNYFLETQYFILDIAYKGLRLCYMPVAPLSRPNPRNQISRDNPSKTNYT